MSHMAAIELQITDLDCLDEACKRLGLQLNRNQSQWRWFGTWVNDYNAQDAAYNMGIKPEEYGKCAEHVITIPGNNTCYEIGVVKRRDGQPGWILLYDFWGTHGREMSQKIDGVRKDGQPRRAGLLEQAYAMEKSAKQLRKEGFKVKIKQEGKQLQCVATRPKTVVRHS